MVTFSPKNNFRESPDAKLHHELVATANFQRAGIAALQHYADILTSKGVGTLAPHEAQANYHKLAGAREFWGVLLNLTEAPETPKPRPQQNLNQSA